MNERAKLIELFAALYCGLQVPVSLGLPLGKARDAWDKIHDQLDIHGWVDETKLATAIEDALARPAGDEEATK